MVIPIVKFKAVQRVSTGVHVMLKAWPHGILVKRRVRLGCGVVAGRQTTARLTPIVTVSIIHRTVQVIQS